MRRAGISPQVDGSSGRRRIVGWVLSMLLVITVAASWAEAQEPQRAGGAGAKATPLSHYVPRQDLLSYLEFEGLDAHPAAWRASAAQKLLNDTKLGLLLEDLVTQYVEASQQMTPEGRRVKSADILAAIKLAARQGFALGVWGKDPNKLGTVYVVRGGDRPEIRALIELAARPEPNPEGLANPPAPEPIQKAGRAIHAMDEDSAWWIEKGDLIVTNQPDAVLAVLDGKQPDAADHPLRTALAKAEDQVEPIAFGFLDLTMLPPLPPQMVRLGLDGAKRIEFALGFEGDALRTVLRAVAPAPRRGLLALVDQPSFDAGSLPPLPAGLTGFTVLSIDLGKTYDQVAEMMKTTDPNAPERVAMAEDFIRQQFGFDLRKDLIAGLGPKLAVYGQALPEGAGAGGNRSAKMIFGLSGITISAQIHDRVALGRAAEPLMNVVNQMLQAVPPGNLAFRKQEGAGLSYILDLPEGMLPPPFATLFRPTIVVGKDQFIVAASTDPARKAAALSGSPKDRLWQPTGAFVPVVRRLPANLIYLRIADPRETMPAIIESLPILAQTLNAQMAQAPQRRGGLPGAPGTPVLRIDPDKLPHADELIRLLFPSSTALVVDNQGASLISREPIPGLTSPAIGGFLLASLVPATQSARGAARRAQCTNNLKQIGLADHNYHAAINTFPMQAIADKDGKPLLSWRVSILPYLEQQELYNKFKLDEPWDSPNNKPLIKEMPQVYLCPDRRNPEPGTTTYRVFVGKGALFEEGEATGIQNVTDGTSNTILVVESKDAVPWTKPDDLKFDMDAKPSLRGAASPHTGGFNALFADGSVHFIKNSISFQVFKALITRASGEVISSDSY
jgi:prepilin-type processing-associated H-X9-DG protein